MTTRSGSRSFNDPEAMKLMGDLEAVPLGFCPGARFPDLPFEPAKSMCLGFWLCDLEVEFAPCAMLSNSRCIKGPGRNLGGKGQSKACRVEVWWAIKAELACPLKAVPHQGYEVQRLWGSVWIDEEADPTALLHLQSCPRTPAAAFWHRLVASLFSLSTSPTSHQTLSPCAHLTLLACLKCDHQAATESSCKEKSSNNEKPCP